MSQTTNVLLPANDEYANIICFAKGAYTTESEAEAAKRVASTFFRALSHTLTWRGLTVAFGGCLAYRLSPISLPRFRAGYFIVGGLAVSAIGCARLWLIGRRDSEWEAEQSKVLSLYRLMDDRAWQTLLIDRKTTCATFNKQRISAGENKAELWTADAAAKLKEIHNTNFGQHNEISEIGHVRNYDYPYWLQSSSTYKNFRETCQTYYYIASFSDWNQANCLASAGYGLRSEKGKLTLSPLSAVKPQPHF